MLTQLAHHRFWKTHGLLIARIIMGGVFLMAAGMKFTNIHGTAQSIAALHNWPFPVILTLIAAFFELGTGLCVITGVFFRKAVFLLGLYVIFLAITFHGPAMWIGDQNEFGFFIDHFVMLAGLLYMLGNGIGNTWRLGRNLTATAL